jgi:CheY-like chemotaxis protein
MMSEESRILIVDDDAVLLDLMARRLVRMGYKPDSANSGEEAISLLEQNLYDLVVTDIYMPKITGLDLIEIIKQRNPETQILAVTGGAMIETVLEALDKGADVYMSKPFDHLKIFDHTVARMLEYHKLLQYRNQADRNGLGVGAKEGMHSEGKGYSVEVLKIIDHLPQPVVLVDTNGNVVAANSIAKDLISIGWDVKAIAPKAFKAALNGGSGASIQVNGTKYKMKAVELDKQNGDTHILFMLQSIIGAHSGGYERVQQYVDVLKTCLSWFYKQRLREKEFRVLRAMAVQVQKIEQIHDGTYEHTRRMTGMTARLPAMEELGKVLSDGPQ